jgi:Na+/melibiose symporter-like transporter
MVGFVAKPGYHNTPEAIHGLSMTYVFAPIALVVVGSVCLIGYKLDAKRQSEIREALEELEARDFASSTEVLGAPGENVAARAS